MSLNALMAAVATQLTQQLTPAIDVLQVTGQMNMNPTPPAIDLYPAELFQEPDAYKARNRRALFTVRARVATADVDYGQTLLLDMMDTAGVKSVTAALAVDGSFNGNCQDSAVEGPTGFVFYTDPVGQGETLLGCEWRLQTILS